MFSQCEVEITTGEVMHRVVDLELVSPPALHLSRRYLSSSRTRGMFGCGWHHNFERLARVDEGGITQVDAIDGDVFLGFDTCDGEQGPEIWSASHRIDPLAAKNALEFVLQFPNGRRETYSRHQQLPELFVLTERLDSTSARITYHYRETLLTVILAGDKRLQLDYHGDGLVASVVLLTHDGRALYTIEYHYDRSGNLVGTSDTGRQAWTYEYDDHLLTRSATPGQAGRNYAYDDRRRCVLAFSDGDLLVRRFQFDDQLKRVLVSDSYGFQSMFRLNEAGQLVAFVDPAGLVSERVLDPQGGLITTIEPDGTSGYFHTFDAAAHLLQESEGNGGMWTKEFDRRGAMKALTSPSGGKRLHEYDGFGRVTLAQMPNGGAFRYQYEGNRVSVTDPIGYRITREDSPDGREVRLFDEFGILFEQRYDELGNLLSERDANGLTTSFSYLVNDVIAEERLPNGGRHILEYDEALNLTNYVDAAGRADRAEYDGLANISAEIDPAGNRVLYEYDREDDLRSVTNQRREAYTIEYDALYDETSVRSFDGRTHVYERDPAGRLAALTDANGNRTTFTYYPDGHIATQVFADEVSDAFLLDEDSRCTGIERTRNGAALQQTRYAYGPVGQLLFESYDGRALEYGWDLAGNLISVKDSLGRETRYIRGRRHQIEKMIDFGREFSFSYRPGGELTSIVYPNGLRQSFEYDAGGRMSQRTIGGPDGAVKSWRRFRYNAEDELIEMTDWRRGRFQYEYDACGRLIRVYADDTALSERYEYDAAGNLILLPPGAGAAIDTGAAIDAGNRLAAAGMRSFDYDAEGNRVEMADGNTRWRYQWDLDGQLAKVFQNQELVAEYGYDLAGRRARKRTASGTTEFLYDDYALRAEIDSQSGNTYYANLSDLPVPIAESGSGGFYVFAYDQIGTPVEAYDEQGDLVYSVHRSAYGSVTRTERPKAANFRFPFAFMGQYADTESGLCYNHFRYYDPAVGRFISQDPIGLDAGLNFYAFPANPNNWVDPMGLMPIFACKSSWGPCRKWYAQMKVDRMNTAMSKRTLRRRCTDCRKDKQREDFEGRCGGGTGSAGTGREVDHIHELQAGGYDRCCNNLCSIPKKFNNQLGTQVGKMLDGPPNIAATVKGATGGVIFKITTKGCTSKKPCSESGKKKLARRPPKANQKCQKQYSKPVALTC